MRTSSDGALDRIADHETGDEIVLSPDAAGRSTTDSQAFRALALDRDGYGYGACASDHYGDCAATAAIVRCRSAPTGSSPKGEP